MKIVKEVKKTKEIIICPVCKGTGRNIVEKRINAYNTDYEEVTCAYCDGKRVVEEVTIVTHGIVE